MPSQGRNRIIEYGFLIYREAFQKRDVYKTGRDCEENHIQKTIGENCFINIYEFVNVISFVGERKHPTNLKMSYKFSCLCHIRSTLRQEDRGLQTKHGYKATKWGCAAIPCLEYKQMRRILPAIKASSGRPLQPSDRVRTSEF